MKNAEYIKLDLTDKDYAEKRAALEAAFKAEYPNNNFSEAVSEDELTSWCKTVAGHGVSVAASAKATRASHRTKVAADINSWDAARVAKGN